VIVKGRSSYYSKGDLLHVIAEGDTNRVGDCYRKLESAKRSCGEVPYGNFHYKIFYTGNVLDDPIDIKKIGLVFSV